MRFSQQQTDHAIKEARKTSTERRAFNRSLLTEQLKMIDAYTNTNENLLREQAA